MAGKEITIILITCGSILFVVVTIIIIIAGACCFVIRKRRRSVNKHSSTATGSSHFTPNETYNIMEQDVHNEGGHYGSQSSAHYYDYIENSIARAAIPPSEHQNIHVKRNVAYYKSRQNYIADSHSSPGDDDGDYVISSYSS